MKWFGFIGKKRKRMLPNWVEYGIATLLVLLVFAGVFVFVWFCYVVLQIQHL
jgi:hypothetical protein